MAMKLYNNKMWLWKRYVKDKKTAEEIALEAGCSRKTIYNKLNEFDLIRQRA